MLSVRQAKSVRYFHGLATSALSAAGNFCVRFLEERLGDDVSKVRANGLSVLASDVHSSLAVLHRDVRFCLFNVFGGLTCRCQVFFEGVNYRFGRALRLFLIKASIRNYAAGRVKETGGRQGASLVGGLVGVIRENGLTPTELVCAGAVRRNERLLTIFNVVCTLNEDAWSVSFLYVRARDGVVQGLTANKSGCPVQVFGFGGVRCTFGDRLIGMRAVTRIVIHECHFQVVISRGTAPALFAGNVRYLCAAPIGLCKEPSTVDAKAGCSGEFVVTRVNCVVNRPAMDRVRVVNLHEVFNHRYIGLLRCERSTCALPVVARVGSAVFRVPLGASTADCLRIEGPLCLHFTGRLETRV